MMLTALPALESIASSTAEYKSVREMAQCAVKYFKMNVKVQHFYIVARDDAVWTRNEMGLFTMFKVETCLLIVLLALQASASRKELLAPGLSWFDSRVSVFCQIEGGHDKIRHDRRVV